MAKPDFPKTLKEFRLSPTAGTLLQDTHMPIRECFWAAFQTLRGLTTARKPLGYQNLIEPESTG